ncbi:MAG: tRNA (uridine(34)/cytosine(34)/5-carboxymethylaminomethyluridine(34)-2'-O)-methyltransferase TrmL [Eubacterium sp.]|nr:tRNA (uridine(34)/cytosine(34)/5-carboxymethylaminomethyluridine(34)-2'-O)-methyltransferase TrmL [Eubacterium sp.]
MLNIVLHEPEMPANTGNIGRTCVATGTALHLIRPYGFILSDKMIKRSGMDYWDNLNLTQYLDYNDFLVKNPGARVFYATTKGKNRYTDVEFKDGDFIMFGKESAGIPEEILAEHPESCIRIPMGHDIRSLNLSNSVAIVLYEALRQMGFPKLETEGELHRLEYHYK